MNIAIRADASIEMGSGHIMRCLTLADELIKQGHQAFFICRDLKGNLANLIREKEIPVYMIKSKDNEECDEHLYYSKWLRGSSIYDVEETLRIIKDGMKRSIDWLIVDHYALDKFWEEQIQQNGIKIMVIDDLADREHKCELLLDQNYYPNCQIRYKDLVPKHAKCLLGPQYALLRDEFVNEKRVIRNRKPLKILVFFGGSDTTNETLKHLNFLGKIHKQIEFLVNVVVGINNPNKEKIKRIIKKNSNMFYHEQVNYMARLMCESDLAICAGGSTTWERYYMNLPAILIAVAHNQIEICESIIDFGIDYYLGKPNEANIKDFEKALFTMFTRLEKVEGAQIVDGYGKNRVINCMMREY